MKATKQLKSAQARWTRNFLFTSAAAISLMAFGASGLFAATATWNSGWSGGSGTAGVPGVGDDIVISSGDLTWSSGAWTSTVSSWTQGSGYTGKVTFDTTYSSGITITGNADLSGGSWTHLDNSNAQTNRVALTVGGNLNVGALGSINVDFLGFNRNNGPGVAPAFNAGAGHGGEGGQRTGSGGPPLAPSYGSILNPTALGSGSAGGTLGEGGGAVRLIVGGTTTLDGTISAIGAPAGTTGGSGGGSGAGGSVWLTTDALLGSGSITVRGGGGAQTAHGGGGAGGRIAVDLTSGTTFGGVTFNSGGGLGGASSGQPAAAGTTYLGTATGGELIINNLGQGAIVALTTLPPQVGTFTDNLDEVTLKLQGSAQVRLDDDEQVSSLVLDSSSTLDLSGNTLILFSVTDKDGFKFNTPGLYTSNFGGFFDNIAFNSGTVEILEGPPIPEPSSGCLLLVGLLALRRRRKSAL